MRQPERCLVLPAYPLVAIGCDVQFFPRLYGVVCTVWCVRCGVYGAVYSRSVLVIGRPGSAQAW